MKPRLCIVNPYEHGGGAEYQISLLIDALAAAGRYEIFYLARFVDGPARARRYQIVKVGHGGAIPRLGYIMDARALFRALREIGPRIIYQRVACAYTGICAAYARRRSIPMLWHVAHDTDVTPRVLDPARNIVRVRLDKWAVGYGLRRATRIIVQTRRQAQLLQTHYARTADAIVPNFHPPAAEIIDKSGPPTVVWISNLKSWKRPDVFVRLAQRFSAAAGVRFVMVGAPPPPGGSPGWREALLQLIDNTPNLDYVGQKSHDEVNALLARAHIFVNTSTVEGFPNTFIQAWQRDVAVVSLSVDPDDVLVREQAGLLANDEPGLYEAVRRLIEEPQTRAAYVERGRAHARAHHSLGNAQALIDLIDGACGDAR